MVLASVGESFQQTAATGPLLLALGACLLAGLVSFASPCVVPLVPGYLSYLAGLVGAEAPPATAESAKGRSSVAVSARAGKLRVAGAAGLFVAGFTVVFVLATATVFGVIQTLNVNRELLQRIGGVVTILMGLVFVGLVPALQRDTRMEPRRLTSLVGAPLLGGVFALGWTPCLGPTLSGVMAVAAGTEGTTAVRGVALIVAYCLGLGLPFVILAFGSAGALRGVGWLRRNSRTIQIVGGILLMAVGVALVTGAWDQFVAWVRDAFVSEVTLPI
ncbi:cytochrome c biogenesis CcdA family protein [Nocardia sp. bgisy134]|uniref:cytochrome c biogenesis CcdA family protein n=1 Tax=unclassified Nocardia TaxID=2637762 RepID=UPI003D7042FF